MITRLEAVRYRCFERLGIDLGDFRVLVGANGAGKTTLLDLPCVLGELLKADNLATTFVVRRGEQPARAGSLRELIFARRGDDFSLAIEAKLSEEVRRKWAHSLIARARPKSKAGKLLATIDASDPDEAMRRRQDRWPTHIRYELRLEVFNERELNVKNEYLFVFAEATAPDRAFGGLHGEHADGKVDWHFILRREYGGLAEFTTEVDPIKGTSSRTEAMQVKPNILAMSAVKYRPDAYPAARGLYELLTEHAVFLDPAWDRLRAASPPGQEKVIVPSALNLPWLALDLKCEGLPPDATSDEKVAYRSEGYADWIAHVKTALPQVDDLDVREREDDHHAYFVVSYRGGFKVPSSGLSDGTLRILTLTLLPYLTRAPSFLVVEEPENGIHPQAITAVMQSLSSLYHSQVLVSSHSPIVLADARLDHLLCAQLSADGGVEIVAGNEHPHLQSWRGEISLGTLFAAGILG